MKTIVLLALGLVATDAKKHRQHQKQLSSQAIQSEIEHLREKSATLDQKFDKLSGAVNNIGKLQSFVQKQSMVPKNKKTIQSIIQLEGPAPFGLAADAKGKPIFGAPAMPSPQPFIRGEKQWMDNGQNINDWGDKQMTVANERIPYWSTVQIDTSAQAAPNAYGLAADKEGKPIAGAPAMPSPQPFVRGEKQWMDNGQNINDWGDKQMTVANERIPYWSTLQLDAENEATPNLYGLAVDKKGKPIAGAPAMPSPQPFVRGEKQWMDNASNINTWQDTQMTVANERIPYMSTFLQVDDPKPNMYGLASDVEGAPIPGAPAMPSPQPFVRGEKQWMDNGQNINDWGTHQMEVANARIPYWSTLVQTEETDAAPNKYGLVVAKKDNQAGAPAAPSPQPFVRGEKQWMDNAANINTWGDQQVEVANTRIPYNSTFVQMRDDDPSKMEGMLMEDTNIPLNLRFVQTKQDDDPNKIESMIMESPDLPLNGYLVHVETKDGDELMRIVK